MEIRHLRTLATDRKKREFQEKSQTTPQLYKANTMPMVSWITCYDVGSRANIYVTICCWENLIMWKYNLVKRVFYFICTHFYLLFSLREFVLHASMPLNLLSTCQFSSWRLRNIEQLITQTRPINRNIDNIKVDKSSSPIMLASLNLVCLLRENDDFIRINIYPKMEIFVVVAEPRTFFWEIERR